MPVIEKVTDLIWQILTIIAYFAICGIFYWGIHLVEASFVAALIGIFLTIIFIVRKRYPNLISQVYFFLILPVAFSIMLTFLVLNYHENDFKTMLLGIYTQYITLTALMLSISFLLISIPIIYRKNRSLPHHDIENSQFFLTITISSVFISLFFHVATSVSSDINSIFTSIFFLISSFFVGLSLFGTSYYGIKILEILSKNPASE